MLVFAFDRDWTVDVNPHPSRQAVPLGWVRELAHETEHAVYAIGNQDLAEEAAIPGVVDIVGMHPDDWDRWLGGKRPDGYYERFPERRERLALIEDLHPEADGYIVVDDLDLSDAAGWNHYHAWDFVPAAERGEIHPELPFVREPTTDGGYPTSAGIIPADAEHLDTWLKEQTGTPAYEIEYTDDGEERVDLCRDISVIRKTMSRAVEPVFRCQPAAPDEESFTVGITDIQQVSAVKPPTEAFLPATDDPAERAATLADLAADNPFSVEVSQVLALLDREDDTPQEAALAALRQVAAVRPRDCTPALPILRSLLAEGCTAPVDALAVLESIGGTDAADIAPLVEVITPYLTDDDDDVRRQAAGCMTKIATADPTDAVGAVSALATLLEDRVATHHAAHTLSVVAEADPTAVKPAVPALADAVTDESLDTGTRLSATAALGRVANHDPTIALDLVNEVAALLGADDPKLRNNATGLLWEISRLHADRVEPHLDTVAELLSADDNLTRVNASAVLARAAEDLPETARGHVAEVRPLLNDEHHLVRRNACWALGYLADEEALDVLRTVTVEDEDEEVRERAQWAVSRIEGVA
ncbi:HEAT repeat domain-containing protein [Haloglomus halophilum]|uniref:HEAT repeat domain-containing protein n=1 Tax=Haloglomus halophilum TaxID=2962672 RepID=UPI0020C94747|nr:HEAT repeat domain-containing protein [Haloglomus halophilum]